MSQLGWGLTSSLKRLIESLHGWLASFSNVYPAFEVSLEVVMYGYSFAMSPITCHNTRSALPKWEYKKWKNFAF
jgi:hypothetical protein